MTSLSFDPNTTPPRAGISDSRRSKRTCRVIWVAHGFVLCLGKRCELLTHGGAEAFSRY